MKIELTSEIGEHLATIDLTDKQLGVVIQVGITTILDKEIERWDTTQNTSGKEK